MQLYNCFQDRHGVASTVAAPADYRKAPTREPLRDTLQTPVALAEGKLSHLHGEG